MVDKVKKQGKIKDLRSRILVGLFSLVGLGIMVYLTYLHFAQTESFCNISEKVSCDVVTTGIYSEVFGLPVSLLGVAYFALVLLMMIFNKKPSIFRTVFSITLFVLFPSLYLSVLELTVIKAWCILCESSKILMLAILVTSIVAAKKIGKIEIRMVIPIIIAGVLAVGVTFFAQSGNVVQADYSGLAECLNNRGMVYYKSVRCSNCQRQEKLFGQAYTLLNSVECHPDGPGGNPELCLEKGIDKTPTFLIEENGQEIDRLEGLTPIDKLAEFAGCEVE